MAYSRAASLVILAGLAVVPRAVRHVHGLSTWSLPHLRLGRDRASRCAGGAPVFLPLGQALFFGMGAYIAGTALKASGDSYLLLLPAMLIACLVPAILAAHRRTAGLQQANRVRAIFFPDHPGAGDARFPACQLAGLAHTGGFNGMTGIPGLPGIDSYGNFYFVVIGVLALVSLGLFRLLKTPFSAFCWQQPRRTKSGCNFSVSTQAA